MNMCNSNQNPKVMIIATLPPLISEVVSDGWQLIVNKMVNGEYKATINGELGSVCGEAETPEGAIIELERLVESQVSK
jgi:hypothetical protein